MERVTAKAGLGLIAFILVWAPIPLGSNRQWAWSLLEILIFAATALAFLQLPYIQRRQLKGFVAAKTLWVLLLAFPMVGLVQYLGFVLNPEAPLPFATVDAGRTLDAVLKGIAYFAFAFAFWIHVSSGQALKLVLWSIICSALFQSLYGIFLLFNGAETTPIFSTAISHRATGSFIYQNHLANFLLVSAALGTGFMVSQFESLIANNWRERLAKYLSFLLGRKMVLRLALIIIVAGLVLTRSRMGNSAFFTALLISSVIALVWYRDRPKIFSAFIISVIALDILLVGSWVGLDKVKQRLEETVVAEEGRTQVIEQALPAVASRPILGFGAGSFYTVYGEYQKQDLGGFYDHAHNDYLQFAVEYGLPATIIVGGGLIWTLALAVMTMHKRRSRLFKGTAFGCTMAIIAMMIHCFVDFNLQAPATTLLFVTVLVLVHLCYQMPKEGWKAPKIKHAAR